MFSMPLIAIVLAWQFPGALAQEAPGQVSQTAQQDSNTSERGTERAPFIVKMISPDNKGSEVDADAPTGKKEGDKTWFTGWATGDKIAAIASFFGLLQAGVLAWTLCVLRLTAKRQLRAYVSVETRGVNPYGKEEKILGHIGIHNNGATPAKNISYVIKMNWKKEGDWRPSRAGRLLKLTLLFNQEPK